MFKLAFTDFNMMQVDNVIATCWSVRSYSLASIFSRVYYLLVRLFLVEHLVA